MVLLPPCYVGSVDYTLAYKFYFESFYVIYYMTRNKEDIKECLLVRGACYVFNIH